MKILIANPPFKIPVGKYFEKYYIRSGSRWPHSGIKWRGTLPHYLPFPFFLAYAAALLKNSGFDVSVSDGVALDKNPEEYLVEEVVPLKPDVVFFEATTPTIENDLLFAASVKKTTGAIVIVGGTHATTHYEQILTSSSAAPDYVIRGEYEFALLELVKILGNNIGDNKRGGLSPELLKKIQGVSYLSSDNTIINTGNTRPIEPLDKLPMPAYEMFPSSGKSDPTIYWDGFCQLRPAIQMHASRGCPYGCYFCLWPQVMYGSRRYRKFSAQRVVDEMEFLVNKYGVREIYFDDDDFTIDKKYVLEICRLIKEKGLPSRKLRWSCMGDIINLDENLAEEMSSAGCIGIKFGVESASPRVLEGLGKPVNLDKIPSALRTCSRLGIKTHATFTIGLLEDNPESVKETMRFVNDCLDVDSIQVSVATPYPGTEFYRRAVGNGLLDEKALSWSDFDGAAHSPLKKHPAFPDVKQLELLRKKFFRRWLLNNLVKPRWIFRQIKNFTRSLIGQGAGFYLKKLFWGIINSAVRVSEDKV